MVSQALKELIALFNVLCGGVLFLVLLVYLLRARPRLWWRLAKARRCHAPAGMKKVGNLFKTPAGRPQLH